MRRTSAIAVGLVLVTACRGPLAPQRVPGSDRVEHLSVPYPIGEPLKEHSGPRVALANAAFGWVRVEPGPTFVTRVLVHDEAGFDVLYEAAFGRRKHEAHAPEPVTREVLLRAGLADPGDSVLLIGDQGLCRAGLFEPTIELFAGPPRHLEIAWKLRGCDKGELAPIAVLASRMPEALRWRPAIKTVDATFTPGLPWKDPRAAVALAPEWTFDEPPTVRAVQVLEIPEVTLGVVQIWDGLMRDPSEGADACARVESWMQTNGWYDGMGLDPIEPGDDPSIAPRLLGAIVHDDQIDALVYDQYDARLVLVPPAHAEDGTAIDWTTTVVDPGLVAPFDRVWTWSALDGEATWRQRCGQPGLGG